MLDAVSKKEQVLLPLEKVACLQFGSVRHSSKQSAVEPAPSSLFVAVEPSPSASCRPGNSTQMPWVFRAWISWTSFCCMGLKSPMCVSKPQYAEWYSRPSLATMEVVPEKTRQPSPASQVACAQSTSSRQCCEQSSPDVTGTSPRECPLTPASWTPGSSRQRPWAFRSCSSALAASTSGWTLIDATDAARPPRAFQQVAAPVEANTAVAPTRQLDKRPSRPLHVRLPLG
mmetsp:Transcript_31587/g.98488  ORF Transcript_31587/g.98488 Transcript_31587/m.98488 type:complete len:229 (+) Transcript_31587:167-853(+)